jgi:exodeoxyribonuclease VII small subunit
VTDHGDDEPGDDDPGDLEVGQEIGYAQAVAELNEILAALDDDSLDIDQLGEKVERAAVLIALCRDRIGLARAAVDQVVGTLDEPAEE